MEYLMDAISLLKHDHRKIAKCFREFEAAGERAFRKRQAIVRKVCTALEIHSQLEQELFYPAVQMTADPQGQDVVRHYIKEHHVVRTIIDELNGMSSEAEHFDSTFKRLAEHVGRHIRHEERHLLPGVAEQFAPESLQHLGQQMGSRKRELTPTHPFLLRDTLRQAQSFVGMAYDALTGVPSAKPPARRHVKAAPKRGIGNLKLVVQATAKRRSLRAERSPAVQAARRGNAPASEGGLQPVRRAAAKAKIVVKKGAANGPRRHP